MRPLGRLAGAASLAVVLLGASTCGANSVSSPRPAPPPRISTSPAPVRSTASTTASTAPRTAGTTSTSVPRTTTARLTKVLVVMEENHSYAQMKQGMPYLAGLATRYGYASHWTALAHPSLPNYIGIAAGSTFGIVDDRSPAVHAADIGAARSVFDQALGVHKTAGTYAETMPDNCHLYDYPDRSVGTPTYAVRHNPWVYFSHGRSQCLVHDRSLTPFAHDASHDALPNVGFLIPNLDHDAHDGSLAAADSWLRTKLSPVLHSSDFTSGRLVVVVTADEDDKHSGNRVLTAVLTPRISHKVVTSPLTHYSLTRFIAQVLGVRPLKNGATAPDLRKAFGF